MSKAEGFLNVLKPPGMTSHDVVSFTRRLFNTRAVGHAGTLDPAATGVLPLGLGGATRLIEYLADSTKTYVGEVVFGVLTDTLDQEGKVLRREPSDCLDIGLLTGLMAEMTGDLLQVPPAHSAIKHQGKPLYAYARTGKSIEVAPRPVTIYSFEPLAFYPGEYSRCLFRVECSKGTYIRSLASDLAQRAGTIGTLNFLLRERVGQFSCASAYTLEELKEAEADPTCLLEPLASAVAHLPRVELPRELADRFIMGQRLPHLSIEDGQLAVYCEEQLLGIGRGKAGLLSPHKVLAKRG